VALAFFISVTLFSYHKRDIADRLFKANMALQDIGRGFLVALNAGNNPLPLFTRERPVRPDNMRMFEVKRLHLNELLCVRNGTAPTSVSSDQTKDQSRDEYWSAGSRPIYQVRSDCCEKAAQTIHAFPNVDMRPVGNTKEMPPAIVTARLAICGNSIDRMYS